MSNPSWIDKYLENTSKIRTDESDKIIEFLCILFKDSNFILDNSELSRRFDEFNNLESLSILAHEIFYLVNIYDQQHDSSYYHSVCLRLLAFNCFTILLAEDGEDIQLVDSEMFWYTDHEKYLSEIINENKIILYSSVLSTLCLQLLHMGSETKHYLTVKNFVEQYKDKKFAQYIYECCSFE